MSAKPIQHSRPPIAALANKVSQLPTKTLNRVATHKAPATLQSRPDEAYYLATLRQTIEAHKRYPRMARHLGIQGRATVAFVLHRDGRITGVQVRTSSGDTGLDAAAFAAVADVERFRPFPEGSTRQTWPISVEIIFSLK
ncbi:TonB family protein [Thioploca ingrica]|uniref:TonB family protein n=1 Tax=Thioploca ingrica TaxID=40754 RepID=A0A090AER8_9GAMM|nr:TonB family protein [Thioploca ingrica]